MKCNLIIIEVMKPFMPRNTSDDVSRFNMCCNLYILSVLIIVFLSSGFSICCSYRSIWSVLIVEACILYKWIWSNDYIFVESQLTISLKCSDILFPVSFQLFWNSLITKRKNSSSSITMLLILSHLNFCWTKKPIQGKGQNQTEVHWNTQFLSRDMNLKTWPLSHLTQPNQIQSLNWG